MKRNKLLVIGVFISAVFILSSIAMLSKMYMDANKQKIAYHPETHSLREYEIRSKTWQDTVTLGAIGDILIHDTVYEDARISKSRYDFKPMFERVASTLRKPDLLLANQETILGGVKLGLSSYPTFNSPHEVGEALVDSGVDIVSTANNHSLDKGENGQLLSLSYLDKLGLPHVGTYKNKKEQKTLKILEKNGITFAYLSYTFGTNGIPVPNGKDYLVNLIDRNKMKDEIHRARKAADVVILSLHWGNEYQRFPTDEQKSLGKFLVNEGVDIVFGHHPHVLQPMDWVKAKDGRRALIVYSLGNFLSGQKWDYKDLGGMASVEVTKIIDDKGAHLKLSNPDFFPTFVSSSHNRNYRVIPLKDAARYGLDHSLEKYDEMMAHMTKKLH